MLRMIRRATGVTLSLALVYCFSAIGVSPAHATQIAAAHGDDSGPCPSGQSLVEIWCVTHQTHHLRCMTI